MLWDPVVAVLAFGAEGWGLVAVDVSGEFDLWFCDYCEDVCGVGVVFFVDDELPVFVLCGAELVWAYVAGEG